MNLKRLICNFSWTMLYLILVNPYSASFDANAADTNTTSMGPLNQRDCVTDSDCIAVTSISYQSCYHIDPQVESVCWILNRKYALEYHHIECFMNVGCREVVNLSCQQGLCIGEAATLPLSIEDTLGKYGFWLKSRYPGCKRINRKLIKQFNECKVGGKGIGTLTGHRFYVCSSDQYGDFHANNTKEACIEDFNALKAAHLLR